jgi:hypothetical protein
MKTVHVCLSFTRGDLGGIGDFHFLRGVALENHGRILKTRIPPPAESLTNVNENNSTSSNAGGKKEKRERADLKIGFIPSAANLISKL